MSSRKLAGSTTSSNARSQSWLTAFTRAIALSGCDELLDLKERRIRDDVRSVSINPGPITTAEPVLFEGVRACQGPSKSGSCEVAKTRITCGYATFRGYLVARRTAKCSVYNLAEMLALQALTPERLARLVPVVTLAEARKIVAQIHRGDAIARRAGRSGASLRARFATPVMCRPST